MASTIQVNLSANIPTEIFVAGSVPVDLRLQEPGGGTIFLGGVDVDGNGHGFQMDASTVGPLTLAAGEALYAYALNVNATLRILATNAATQGGVQHVVIDSGMVIADQGSPNVGGIQAWPTTKP